MQDTPETSADFYNRGIAHKNKDDYDQAIANYTHAIRLNPNLAKAFINRGNVYAAGKNDLDLAIADYDQAIWLDPKLASAYFNRGVAYGYKADYDRAIADYTQAIRLDPNNADAKQGLEEARRARGR